MGMKDSIINLSELNLTALQHLPDGLKVMNCGIMRITN